MHKNILVHENTGVMDYKFLMRVYTSQFIRQNRHTETCMCFLSDHMKCLTDITTKGIPPQSVSLFQEKNEKNTQPNQTKFTHRQTFKIKVRLFAINLK